MKFDELLTEIRVGKDVLEELEYNEDLEDDMDTTLEEGKSFFRASKRLNKMADKIAKKDAKGSDKLASETRKMAKAFYALEQKYRLGASVTKAFARDKMVKIKKSFDRMVEMGNDKELMKEMREARAFVLWGSVLGTMFFAMEPAQKIAAIPTPTQIPQRRFVPFPLRSDLRIELTSLNKNSSKNFAYQEVIREDEE